MAKAWTCPTCAKHVATPYCPDCGERRIELKDLTLRGLFRQFLNAISSVDGRLIRSLRALFVRPGSLTVAWNDGPRKPYVGPIQLFLLANVAFVAVQSFTGTNIFSSPLDSHLHHQDWSALAQRMVADKLVERSIDLGLYEPTFDRAVAFYAKWLVILMTIPFAILLSILLIRRSRPFAVHMVFALHVYGFLLFLYCGALVVSQIDVLRGGAGLASPRLDTVLTVLNLSACAAYLYFAIGRVYGLTGLARVVIALALSIAVLAIALAYRFGLFVLTLGLN